MALKLTKKRSKGTAKVSARVGSVRRSVHNLRASDPSGRVCDWIDVEAARLIVVHDAWSGMGDPRLRAFELHRAEGGGFRGEASISSTGSRELNMRVFQLRRNDVGSALRLRTEEIANGKWGAEEEHMILRLQDDPAALVAALRQAPGLDVQPASTGRVEPVVMIGDEAGRLLRYISQAFVYPGAYEPRIDHTDDFPRIEVAVHVNNGGNRDGVALFYTSSQGELHAPWGGVLHGEIVTLPGDELGSALQLVRGLIDDQESGSGDQEQRRAVASDWKTKPMPKTQKQLAFRRSFARGEWMKIRAGLVPVEMEDKWFIYADDEWLWFHRSWTGLCIYKARIRDTDHGGEIVDVWVNNNKKQYELDKFHEPDHLSHLIDVLLLRVG